MKCCRVAGVAYLACWGHGSRICSTCSLGPNSNECQERCSKRMWQSSGLLSLCLACLKTARGHVHSKGHPPSFQQSRCPLLHHNSFNSACNPPSVALSSQATRKWSSCAASVEFLIVGGVGVGMVGISSLIPARSVLLAC